MPGTAQRRRPAVAGSFYPASADDLAATADGLLDAAAPADVGDSQPVALVVPHAGYTCSGPVAATAYRRLTRPDDVHTVVILGPAHHRDPHGLAVPECDAWLTPLGEVPVDQDLCGRLVDLGLAHRDDRAHDGEHSLEVQLPFLQRLLGEWACVPVVAGLVPAEVVADCLDAIWAPGSGDGVLVLASSDLSHYHDEETAQRLDRRTAQAVVDLEIAAVGDRDACGAVVVRGLMTWAQRRELTLELIDLHTSAETCSTPDRVVGYGAFAARLP